MKIASYFRFVKFSHTIFALPFALVSYIISLENGCSLNIWLFIKVLLCMVFARNAAMSFNRIIDRKIDALNPRTQNRELPSKLILLKHATIFLSINIIGFIITSYTINMICFFLSPVALLVILGYSFTKRFTYLCHFILGIGLALAPIGAYLASCNAFNIYPVLLGIIVCFWVSGFDIIYSLQDMEFDRQNNLHSIPSKFGIFNSIIISRFCHLICILFVILFAYLSKSKFSNISIITWVGSITFIVLLAYQNLSVNIRHFQQVNVKYMTINGISSLVYGFLIILDFVLV